ncbi:UDP-2,3-diacylglucosamine diphosphatase [Calditrichota bacterium]
MSKESNDSGTDPTQTRNKFIHHFRERMKHHRAIFLSDIHLGSKAFQAEKLMRFLKENHADNLYLVGDIIDIWRMKVSGVYFPQLHVNILRMLMGKASKGTKIFYLPGNHDELVRDFIPNDFGNFTFANEVEYETADKQKLLVIHGDQLDLYINALNNPVFRQIIDWMYAGIIWANRLTRPMFKRQPMSERVIGKLRQVKQYFFRFEQVATNFAKEKGYDGVICGHIHFPKINGENGFKYINCGDWIDNCTAIVEDFEGNLELVRV